MMKVSKHPTENSPDWSCGQCGSTGAGVQYFKEHRKACLEFQLWVVQTDMARITDLMTKASQRMAELTACLDVIKEALK